MFVKFTVHIGIYIFPFGMNNCIYSEYDHFFFCLATEWNVEYPPGAMDNRDRWRENVMCSQCHVMIMMIKREYITVQLLIVLLTLLLYEN